MLKKIICRSINTILLLYLCLGVAFAQNKGVPTVKDELYPARGAAMNGLIGQKLEVSYQNRILAQDPGRLIAPFMQRNEDHCWQGEFWGKWFTSAVLAYQYNPGRELKLKLDEAVNGLLETQSKDGYIGNYDIKHRLEQWDIWGRKYSMLGLIAYYDLTGERKVLKAAEKMADHLLMELAQKDGLIVNKGNYRGMPATSVLEPVIQLYKRTKQKKYLNFAEDIVKQWELASGPQLISKADIPVGFRFPFPKAEQWATQGQKAYEMMSCYEGLLELYRITGNKAYKTAVEKTWQSIFDTEIDILGSGSASECWYDGRNKQQFVTMHADETCVTVTWIKLSQQLLRLTGDVKYADAIERSFYNALLGAMKPDGATWGMYSPTSGIRTEGTDQCKMGLNCCVASGPRGLFTIPMTAVMGRGDGIQVNFFSDGTYKLEIPGKEIIELIQQTDYPVGGKISMMLNLKSEQEFPVYIRIPAWSSNSVVMVNGKPLNKVNSGEYALISRKWKNGDKIELELDMRGRIESQAGLPVHVALYRGPIVLTRDMRLTGATDIDEIITPVTTADGFVPLTYVQPSDSSIAMSFSVPCIAGSWRIGEDAKPLQLTFIDYASAGNTFSSASRYRVWFPQLINPVNTGIINR